MFRNQTALKIQTVKIRCLQKYTKEWYLAPSIYNYFFSFFFFFFPTVNYFIIPVMSSGKVCGNLLNWQIWVTMPTDLILLNGNCEKRMKQCGSWNMALYKKDDIYLGSDFLFLSEFILFFYSAFIWHVNGHFISSPLYYIIPIITYKCTEKETTIYKQVGT